MPCISDLEVDVNSRTMDAPAGLGDHRLAGVDADRPSLGPDQARELPGVVTGATANVDHGRAAIQRKRIEHRGLRGADLGHGVRQVDEADEERGVGCSVDHAELADVRHVEDARVGHGDPSDAPCR
jgi:hypothetical protein